MQMTSWKHWAVGSVAALTIMAGTMWTTDSVSAASPDPAAVGATDVQAVRYGRGQMDHGFGRYGDKAEMGQTYLAEALGISVEELEAAQDAARTKASDEALAQAVADGKLTQAQADAIKELRGLHGNRLIGRLHMGSGDHNAYLAEALGISVEGLEAAKDAAIQAGIAQAVADGKITQEQADEMLTRLELKDYLVAEMDAAFETAIQKAVADGVITQEEADDILENDKGFFGRGIRGRFHDGMRGGFPGMRGGGFGIPDTQSNSSLYVTPGSLL